MAEIQERRASKVEFTVEKAIEIMLEIATRDGARDCDKVSAAKAAGSWLAWEKAKEATQTAVVVVVNIGGTPAPSAN